MSIPCPSDKRDGEDRAFYEETRNPVYLFMAIGRYAVDEPLPAWIRRELREATAAVLRAALSEGAPVPALQDVLRAFGFVRPGWNAIRSYRRDRDDGFVTALYGLRATKGQTKVAATDLGKVRSVRRRVAKISRIRGKVSQPTP